MDWGNWGEALGSGLGSVIGGQSKAAGPDYNSIFGNIDIPALQDLIAAGKIDGTAFDQIKEDPAMRGAQVQALNEMSNEGNRNGASIQGRAAQAQLLDQANTSERMNREAILAEMARRGQSGGGQELASRMMANQEGARRAGLGTAQIAGDDRTRALAALQQAGQLGGSIRGQDYTVAANRAQAQDALSRWNAQNARSAYGDNMQWQMQRANGRAGLAPQQYGRATNMGAGIGSLAGGAYDYWNNGQNANGNASGGGYSDVAGGDWGAGATDTAGGYYG